VRAFVAVALPVDVRDHLDRQLRTCRAEHPTLRWVAPERWHLTLTFLGDVDAAALSDLRLRLGRGVVRSDPFRLQLLKGGRFGDHVLWAGVGGDRDQLRRLAERTTAAARRAGIDVEHRPHRPHLTLARAPRPTDLRAAVGSLDEYAGPGWTVADVELVRSTLGPTPRYDTLATYPLAAG